MQALLDGLIKVKAMVLAGEHARDQGICYNLRRCIAKNWCEFQGSEYQKTLYILFNEWPEFSGSLDCPVKHPDYDCEYDAFVSTVDVWVGEYGAARMRLLDWMIDELQRRGYVISN